MKKRNYFTLTIMIAFTLCCAVLAGCGQNVDATAPSVTDGTTTTEIGADAEPDTEPAADTEPDTDPTADVGSSTDYIGIEEAKAIALNHAGLSASDVSFSKEQFEEDNGRKEYEVEFLYNGTEYEYVIDASSGSIIKYDSERND